jgi:hypothetical protein|uniref:protein-export membrane protein SecG n=1 Tax=Eustigmatophyceae sp. WTwin 8/9 T-6m6.8 TaxID=2974615 RepID=UPI0021825143|nr:protein-export membrane protein SecG [Eustigmatophyceae sp. WTwin 8/9 T-6m6.8]UVI61016.1 protein-export membrane protein SecG [Eustigmatophyceae sp. WTwin 8/9 T-6m6.8]
MRLFLNIIFFCQVVLLSILIITRNPSRIPGFERTRNQNIDRLIFILIGLFLLLLIAYKIN